MAINPIEFLRSASVDVANGSNVITVNGSVDCSSVYSGTAVYINDNQPVEAIAGTAFNPATGVSTITLRYNWDRTSVTAGTLVAFNTKEGLNSAVTRLNEIIKAVPDFTGVTGAGLLYDDGAGNYTAKPIGTTGEAVLASSTEAESRLAIGLNEYGISVTNPPQNSTDVESIMGGGLFAATSTAANIPAPGNVYSIINAHYAPSAQTMILMSLTSDRVFCKRKASNVWQPSFEFYTTSNLTGSTLPLDSYTVATLPSAAANTQRPIFVSDLAGQAAPCYSDGTNWRRYSDNTIAS